jgi:NodT family efflux transporter outer membrane factor (OMF) lipoprotein
MVDKRTEYPLTILSGRTRRRFPPPAALRSVDGRLAQVACRDLPSRFLFLGPLVLSACAVGPDYSPPAHQLPQAWNSLPSDVASGNAALGAWWEGFRDATLSALIRRAIEGNLDLRVATSRVAEARALYRVDASALYPSVDLDGQVSYQRQSENGILPGGEAKTLHSVDVSASWEVDLFGRVRRAVEARGASAQASEEDRRNVLVSICAEVARSYVIVRTLQARLAVARANLESQGRVVDLTRARREGGIASSLDVAQAESVYANTQTTVPPLQALLEQELNRLSVLLGKDPRTLWEELSAPAPIPGLPANLAVDLPVDLVRQRPDVRRAERELAAQTALIGVAAGDLYPRFTLFGSFGFAATDAAVLFNGASRMYSVGPSVNWNIFAAGRIRALIKVQEARADQALGLYEAAVLRGLEEVEDALVSFDQLRKERQATAEAVRAASLALDFSTALYKDGLADFQNVLDAQRVVLQFQDALTRIDGAVVQSLIQLYRALGGGWGDLESGHQPDGEGR